MDIITLDFESYWSQTYSLSRMSPLEYVMGDEFETISCSIKLNEEATQVFFGHEDVAHAFKQLPVSASGLLAHNMSGFDAYIAAFRFKLRPKLWLDTAAMARPIHAKTIGVSLAKLVKHYGVGIKDNTILMATRGKHLKDFTPAEIADMAVYNKDDTDQCWELFKILRKVVPAKELWQIDLNTRMRTEPAFVLDRGLLQVTLEDEVDAKRRAMMELATHLSGDEPNMSESFTEDMIVESVREQLASAPKFSALLASLGVEVPVKPSPSDPTGGKMVPALAKSDEEFVALTEHDNPIVAAAARARLAVKSTLLETRIHKLLTAGKLAGGKLPVPIRYAGADTSGRDSGEEYNMLNLPRINPDVPRIQDALRNSLLAGRGKKIIVADQSNIELRVNHTLWKVKRSMDLWAANPDADLYSDYASSYYGKPAGTISKSERQFAKVCIAEGELVLTSNGPKPIQSVSVLDLVWDGVEWVKHDGPIFVGEKTVITYDGLTATPDHEVWVEDGRKVYLGHAAAQRLRLARTGAGGAPVGFGGAGIPRVAAYERVPRGICSVRPVQNSAVGKLRQPTHEQDSGVPIVPAEVRSAGMVVGPPRSCSAALHQPERCSVSPLRWAGSDFQLSLSGCGRSVGDEEPWAVEEHGNRPGRQQRGLRAGELAVGDEAAERSEQNNIEHQAVSHVSTRAPIGKVRGQHPSQIDVERIDGHTHRGAVATTERQTKRRVWDILNAGPRHRFTVSNVLVSNCQLGLGFGSGASTFRTVAKLMSGGKIDLAKTFRNATQAEIDAVPEYDWPTDKDGFAVVITGDPAQESVDGWRAYYPEIVAGWRSCDDALMSIFRGERVQVDPWGLVHTSSEGFVLPGYTIRYPGLRQEDKADKHGRTRKQWVYAEGRHKAGIYGSKAVENIVQSLARATITDNTIEFFKRTGLRPALRPYDELVYVVDEGTADDLLAELQVVMRTPPTWWSGLTVWSAGSTGRTYGEAK